MIYQEVSGTGPALVFINPGALDCRIWDPQWTSFSRSFRTLRYDPRGWSRSEKPNGPFSHLRDLADLMDAVDFPKAHLVGSSFGGSLALDFALAFPDRVDALVLVGAGGPQNGFPLPEDVLRAFAPIGEALRRSFAQGIDAWLELDTRLPRDPELRALLRENALANESYWKIPPSWMEAPSPPAADRLDEIPAPTLVLVGERDHSYTHGVAEALEKGIPNARRTVVKGAGHLVHLERPAVFDDIVREFLDGISRRGL